MTREERAKVLREMSDEDLLLVLEMTISERSGSLNPTNAENYELAKSEILARLERGKEKA